MRRKIILQQHIQPNGSIHHVPSCNCPLEPCVIVTKEGEAPESICDMLQIGIDGNEQMMWSCNKTPCLTGD
jgi:hypothetical protein